MGLQLQGIDGTAEGIWYSVLVCAALPEKNYLASELSGPTTETHRLALQK